jgi:hypothetical protein
MLLFALPSETFFNFKLLSHKLISKAESPCLNLLIIRLAVGFLKYSLVKCPYVIYFYNFLVMSMIYMEFQVSMAM